MRVKLNGLFARSVRVGVVGSAGCSFQFASLRRRKREDVMEDAGSIFKSPCAATADFP